MGIVSSKPDDGATLYLRDQNRLSISSLVISNPRRRSSVNIVPNAFPATRVSASRPLGDGSPIEFVQDTEVVTSPGGVPNFILKLNQDDELVFTFTFVIRQGQQFVTNGGADAVATTDTQISGLTYVYASTPREVENLVTREFHADPNLHKNSNVELVGDFATGGTPSVSFEWTWKWKPPKSIEDRGGGWRNSCSFVEYDPRAHCLHTLASFSYWVSNPVSPLSHPNSPSPPFLLTAPPKIRVASSQSVDSRISHAELDEPLSPLPGNTSSTTILPVPQSASEPIKVDVACPKPTDDVLVPDDGPVFRATIKSLEQKTGNMRTQMKRVLKMAKQAHEAQQEANKNFSEFIDTLREASSTNANAVQPAIEHYFDKIAREILAYERTNTVNLKRIVIDPLDKFYTVDIKQAESKKRDFEEESKDYYAYVSRYLGQRHDSVKAKKLAESDSKYQTKRRNFELKRFDYSSFMQDLHGGRKEQEVLSHLTRYADAQTKSFLEAAKKIDTLLPQLEALSNEVQEADKEYQYQRREREEKRRLLEKSNQPYNEPDPIPVPGTSSGPVASSNGTAYVSDSDLGRADSTGSQLKVAMSSGSNPSLSMASPELSRSPGSLGNSSVGSPAQASKFKGIRDLEEKDYGQSSGASSTQRKEGLLWSLSKGGSNHVDPRNLNKQGWHKFWIVLDQGKLSEYSNWKQRLDLHNDPIDLRMASVREARNAERRFCFEVITPQFKRVYQATSEEDMNSWITSINNALQSAVEGRIMRDKSAPSDSGYIKRDIGSILTGKSPSVGHNSHHSHANSNSAPVRRITVGARPSTHRSTSSSFDENPDKLLQLLRDNDQGNCWCADCGSGTKVEWVSINLAIILCIECSGIHRSLGTHISKVRSLTLDINSFTSDIVELLLLVGNRVSNMIWEAKLEPGFKPTPQATREMRLRFITAKYVDRAYVEPISATLSRYPNPDDTLLAAIKKNEIQQVIYALALRASPNVTDRSRGTHAVFLALAAADPASPSPTPGQPPETDRTVPFPVAEMLLQNGAEVPLTMPAFPLSRSAQLYIEEKRGRSTGFSNDSVGSLPGNLSPNEKLQRERDARLQKRVSAGGRLAKSPIPER
ncbi:PH domain-containing protein [Colletotrichum costaricense]|uniref:ADP-ribosylation factor GTPase-activating protein n=2 Tax=Colletotrichum acutatum species complex TaxID=2707335 RepID=A0AAJ0DUZ4_9PEZI|nr:PH domain-containing protein [Colletotrichum costaricense]XP_060389101.1 PH domain-containing protein [Colletotrichum tamarilloi]KAI3545029.1 PH domain-containing protein [Colletotrichum filicis]KAK1513027.1 PH domain-containing protein [Colletotrichum tamarilloi]KAK1514486.1 PH domain-containing protein [Colletotrichum costaricense]